MVVDSLDRLWILDTGRVYDTDGTTLVPSSYGGPKLIRVDLTTDTVVQTILFPQTVAYQDSYLNDVRFDLRASSSESGKGLAYITDSSVEGRNGLITADLGTGEIWRHLDGAESVRPDTGFVGFAGGLAVYQNGGPLPGAFAYLGFGSDGIAISADGESLFWCPLSARRLYSIPTSLLRGRGPASEVLAQQGVRYHGQKGLSDGFETDSNGLVYMGNIEQNAVVAFNPRNGTVSTFVRDPRINWSDTCELLPPCHREDDSLIANDRSLGVQRWLLVLHEQPAPPARFVPRDGPSGQAVCSVQGEVTRWRRQGRLDVSVAQGLSVTGVVCCVFSQYRDVEPMSTLYFHVYGKQVTAYHSVELGRPAILQNADCAGFRRSQHACHGTWGLGCDVVYVSL